MSIKGDFISFTYNGVHSTELGIVRVTASNRYTDQLLPTIQDKTVQVPGGNGTYFFGSYYTQRAITINIAYDSVTEAQLREMRRVFSADAPHELIFDDEPYKIYYAKITGTPQLQYIPFDSEDAIYSRRYINDQYTQTYYERVYKGEGTLTFTCFDPFAHCLNECKYLDQYVYIKFNKNEFEQGAIATATGENSNSLYRIRQISYFPQIGGQTLVLNTNFNYYKIFFYDINQIKIDSTSWLINGTSYLTPLDTQYIRIVLTNKPSDVSDEDKITINDFSYVYIKSINSPYWYNPTWIQRAYSKQYKIGEWNQSAHLLNSRNGYDNDSNTSLNQYKLYNPGDIETDFELFVPYGDLYKINSINITDSNELYINGNLNITSKFTPLKNNEVRCICFNSKMNLIEEAIESGPNTGIYRKTGIIFNEIIESGSWPKIPQTGYKWVEDGDNSGWEPKKNILFKINVTEGLSSRPTLRYDYLYY